MCNIKKILKVVTEMFPEQVVSIGTKHKYSTIQTALLAGRIEFNPAEHRRDAFDALIHFNLYVKKLPTGLYECGAHNPNETTTRTDIRPTMAITEMAYYECKKLDHQST